MEKYVYGLLNLAWWQYLLATLILTQITIACVTIYLHRHQAHRALDLHPLVSHPMRFWLWLTTGMTTKVWTAIHRKHHAKCETAEDPHSPQILGLKKVLWYGAELYRKEAQNQETLARYGQGTPSDWLERNLYERFSYLGIILMALLDLLLFGLPGVSIWGIQMLWIPLSAAGIINGIGHYWGYRNFECQEAARNILPLGLLIGGEELHNNHHAFGSSAKFSNKWWEIDLGWGYIKCLQWLRLAKVKKLVPKLFSVPHKNKIDVETLKALILNQLPILARYGREVILPVLRTEKSFVSKSGQNLLKQAKVLLLREKTLIDEFGRARLNLVLQKFNRLKEVYLFKQKLEQIWQQTTATQAELLEALQLWCKQAEESGIHALREFSLTLRNYVTTPFIKAAVA